MQARVAIKQGGKSTGRVLQAWKVIWGESIPEGHWAHANQVAEIVAAVDGEVQEGSIRMPSPPTLAKSSKVPSMPVGRRGRKRKGSRGLVEVPEDAEFLSVAQAAEVMGIGQQAVYSLIRRGILHPKKDEAKRMCIARGEAIAWRESKDAVAGSVN